MPDNLTPRRLGDLLVDAREALDVEIKGWIDLVGSNEDKATLAKALLALANHGGGFVLIGLAETDTGIVGAEGRPPTLNGYSQDNVNGIVQSYADPPFHCAVHHVAGPDGAVHPVIIVPGGHRVPIRARRGGPLNQTVQGNAIYIRRPGPSSETPQSAQDWDDLLARCLAARRDELMDRVRDLFIRRCASTGGREGTGPPRPVDRDIFGAVAGADRSPPGGRLQTVPSRFLLVRLSDPGRPAPAHAA